jgi:hypothetical protein
MLGVVAPANTRAQPSQHIKLQLNAPATCPDTAELLRRVDVQLGAEFETDSQLRAMARVRELGPADYELQLSYETDNGATDERILRGESCRAVSDAAVLLLAIALNPSAALEVPQPEPKAADPEAAAAWWAPQLGAFAALDTALMGRPTFGVGAQLGVRLGPLELSARSQLFLPRSVDREGTTTTLNGFSFDLVACVPWRIERLMLGPCVRAEVGRLAASVAGAVEAQTPGAARFQALALGAEVRVRVAARLWLALAGDANWFTRRPQFLLTDLGEVERPAKFGMRVYLGPQLIW